MSLLNDVLRDLQTRGVFGVPPLAGLQPVTDVPAHHRRRALLLPVLGGVFVASTIVLWQPVSNGTLVPSIARMFDGTPAQPQIEIQADSLRTAPIEPAPVAATGDDLRELFGVDNTIASRAPAVTEFTAEPVTDVPPVTTASRIETVVADLSPQAASDDTSAASPSTASMAAIESQPSNEPATVVESPAPAATPAPPTTTGTNIINREPDTDDVEGLVARGVKSMRANDPFTAESMFRAALLVESGDAEIWGYLYSVLNKTSRPEAAEKALQQGLVAADEPAPLAKLYARVLLDSGKKDAAISLLRIHRPPAASDLEYDSFLAALLQQQGQFADAGEIYETLLTVDPASGATWIGLAMSHDSLGNRADALSAFERALTTGSLKPPLARYARRRSTELKADD
jgi:Flp pilus assembly protein TadD